MRRASVLAAAAIFASSAVAVADPSTTPPDKTVATPPSNDGFPSGDAASGRAYVSPTAFTSPAGTGTITSWFPGLPVVGVVAGTYAITDRIEIGAGATYSGGDGVFAVNYLEARVQVLRRARSAIAVEYQRMSDPEDGNGSITALTVVGSHCLGASCRTVVSAHLSAIPETWSDSETRVHIVGGGSLITGGKIKLVADGGVFEIEGDRALVLYGGVRYATHRFAADLGGVLGATGDDAALAPVPLAAISVRF